VYHQVAWRRKLWVPLFAVVAVTACQKAPAPQSEPAAGSIRSTPRPAPETTETEPAKFQGNLLVLERDTPQLTDFPESSLSPAHTAAAKELQGTWKVTEFHTARGFSAVEDGRIIPYTFEGNKLITVGPGDVRVEIEYRLDPTKSPKQIDQRFTGGAIGPWIAKGIYKLEGDTLTICYGGRNVARPTEFAAKPEDGRTMRVHKRVE
jgi:uncharacterized protein (TIGR03067 family)